MTEPCDLTFGAEGLGYTDTDEACELLVSLASHTSSIVREGAIYGLSRHLKRESARNTLQLLATTDVSITIRECALEVLEI